MPQGWIGGRPPQFNANGTVRGGCPPGYYDPGHLAGCRPNPPRRRGLHGLDDDFNPDPGAIVSGWIPPDSYGIGTGSTIGQTTNTASTGGFDGSDWASFILNAMKLAPNIISAGKGTAYQSGQFGQSGGQQGLNLTGSSILGGGSLGISSSTLMLLGLGLVVIFMMKK